jgi:hypothetical protein
MAKVTLVFAALLIALGFAGYLGTGSLHPTALIPTWFGVALGIFGFLAISPNESRRKIFMHINVTIGLIGFVGAAVQAGRELAHASVTGGGPNPMAVGAQIAMAVLLLVYVALCVRSFIAVRRARKV